MYNIGEKIVNKNGKVCEIIAIEEKDYGAGLKTYYVLQPYFSANESMKIFVPTDKQDSLRNVMSKKQIKDLLSKIESIETVWYANPKVRKTEFKELYSSGNPIEIFRLIKSFEKKKFEFKDEKKSLSFTDESFLKEIKRNMYNEIAVSLEKPIEEIESLIDGKLKF